MKKIRPIKKIWYAWLINYIPQPIIKSVGGFMNKIVSLVKTNTPKQAMYGRGKKLSKPKKQNKQNPFISEENKKNQRQSNWRHLDTLQQKKNKKKKKLEKEIELNERFIKDRIIRDIKILLEQEEDYYCKPKRVSDFWNNNYI